MPNAYLQGIQTAFDNQAEVRNNIYVVASNWFVNRCPLVTRIPRLPVGSTTFTIVSSVVEMMRGPPGLPVTMKSRPSRSRIVGVMLDSGRLLPATRFAPRVSINP